MILRVANANDIPRLLDVFESAFGDDEHTQLKIAWRGPASMREGMASALHSWLANPSCALLVGEEPRTGTIAGWACWALVTGQPLWDTSPVEKLPGAATSLVDELERMTNSDIERCRREVIPPGTVVHVLVAIAVAPEHQRRGAGRALVQWGRIAPMQSVGDAGCMRRKLEQPHLHASVFNSIAN